MGQQACLITRRSDVLRLRTILQEEAHRNVLSTSSRIPSRILLCLSFYPKPDEETLVFERLTKGDGPRYLFVARYLEAVKKSMQAELT